MKWGINWKLLLVRTAVSIVVIGSLYGLLIALPRYRKHHHHSPQEELTALRVSVEANSLAFNTLTSVNGADTNSVTELTGLRGQLGQAITDLQAKVDHH